MKTGTILCALAMLCFLTGCTKKPAPKKLQIGNHRMEIEMSKQVMVGHEATATALWSGGTAPFAITWTFSNIIDNRTIIDVSSPSTVKFVIPASKAKIGQKYTIQASIVDAEGLSSYAYGRFIFVSDPLKPNPTMYRSTMP